MYSYSKVAHTVAATCAALMLSTSSLAQRYVQTNLVSDIAQPANANGTPVNVDPDLVNAWGLARGAASPWWVNNGGTGTSTLYTGAGATVPLVVTIPNSQGAAGPSMPTGMIFNGSPDFELAPGNPAAFIFATKNGTIAGWGPPATPVVAGQSTAITKVDEGQAGAVFTGLTWVQFNGAHFLLAANFRENQIEVFDRNFIRASLPEQFQDTTRPSNFAPYNIQAVGPVVVVTYAKQNAAQTAPVDEGGIVAVFSGDGRFLFELQNGPWLRAPWGVALAPQDFGVFSHHLLIGNRFGGTIAAFDPVSGKFRGNLLDATGTPLSIDGLWGIEFDNRGNNEAGTTTSPSTGPALFFAAGINNYAHGLFGTLTPVAAELNAEDHE
ncbi:MAG TPA: TIGR03118 family protein [Steroidobacteraceae bacterium]